MFGWQWRKWEKKKESSKGKERDINYADRRSRLQKSFILWDSFYAINKGFVHRYYIIKNVSTHGHTITIISIKRCWHILIIKFYLLI